MDSYSTDSELLAVVDEKDIIIGAKTRRAIHDEGLRHRAVHILVLDATGRICLQKRSMNKDVNPGAWDTSAAGHVDYGESYQAAAERELSEELGINAFEKVQPVGRIEASEVTGWEFIQVFAVRHHGPLAPNPEEIDALQWVTLRDLNSLLLNHESAITQSFRRVIACFEQSDLFPSFFPESTG